MGAQLGDGVDEGVVVQTPQPNHHRAENQNAGERLELHHGESLGNLDVGDLLLKIPNTILRELAPREGT